MEITVRSLIKVLSQYLPAGSEGHQRSTLRTVRALGEIQIGCLPNESSALPLCQPAQRYCERCSFHSQSDQHGMIVFIYPCTLTSHDASFLRVYTIEHKYAQTVTEPLLRFMKTIVMFKLWQEHNLHRCHDLNGMGPYCSYCTME
jgi:hypothetical protein